MKLPDMTLSKILRKPLTGLQKNLVPAVECRARVKTVEIGRSSDPRYDYCMSVEKSINNRDYSDPEYAKAAARKIVLIVPGLVSEVPVADPQEFYGCGSHSRYRGLVFLMAAQVEKLAEVLNLPQVEKEVSEASKTAINARANVSFINQVLSPCFLDDGMHPGKVHEVIETTDGYEVILDPPIGRSFSSPDRWSEEPKELKEIGKIEKALCDKLGFVQEPGATGHIDFEPGPTFRRDFVDHRNYVQVVAERLEPNYYYGYTKIKIAGPKNRELIEKLFWDAVVSAPCKREELEAEPGKRGDFKKPKTFAV